MGRVEINNTGRVGRVSAGGRAAEDETAVRAGQLHADQDLGPAGLGAVQRDAGERGGGGHGGAEAGRCGPRGAGRGHGRGHAVRRHGAGLREHVAAVPGHGELVRARAVRAHQAVRDERGERQRARPRERAAALGRRPAARAPGAGARPGGGRGARVRAPHGLRPVPHGGPARARRPAGADGVQPDRGRAVAVPARGRHRAPGARHRAPDDRARGHRHRERHRGLELPAGRVRPGRPVRRDRRPRAGARRRQPDAGRAPAAGARPAGPGGGPRGRAHGPPRVRRLRARDRAQLAARPGAAHRRGRARAAHPRQGADRARPGPGGPAHRGPAARPGPAAGRRRPRQRGRRGTLTSRRPVRARRLFSPPLSRFIPCPVASPR